MGKSNNNTWFEKLKRTCTSLLPVEKKRAGSCIDCGECCKLPNPCYFLRFKEDGRSYCSIHIIRPLVCRKYPRTKAEWITRDSCGFRFK